MVKILYMMPGFLDSEKTEDAKSLQIYAQKSSNTTVTIYWSKATGGATGGASSHSRAAENKLTSSWKERCTCTGIEGIWDSHRHK